MGAWVFSATRLLVVLCLSVGFRQVCLGGLWATHFRHSLTSGVIVALALGVGAWLLCATHLFIMFYLAVRFR